MMRLLSVVLLGFLSFLYLPLEAQTAGGPGATGPVAAAPIRAAFQPYIFWAYGLACALIFFFTLWTLGETKRLGARLEYLKDRFRKAHPGALDDEL